MVRPAAFAFNEQTAGDNAFQQRQELGHLQQTVLQEFDGMVTSLRDAGIDVIVIEDTRDPAKPDAIFPNNWFCTLPGGTIATFPMHAPNRRIERRHDIIDRIFRDFKVVELEDWTAHESHQQFLEGTGSMVMDHNNKIIYACISERTDPLLLHQFGERTGYEVVSFVAKDPNGIPVYHTNVLMCIGNGFCVACTDMIDEADRDGFTAALKKCGTGLIPITYRQVQQFCGNMLQLQDKTGEHVLVMSSSAFHSFDKGQLAALQANTRLLQVNIPTIETVGGGGARCMMAEIFLLPSAK